MFTQEQKELQAHIQAENAKTQAWVDECPEKRWAGMTVDDPAHWAKYGVTTIAQYERYHMEADFSDLYKSAHGIRPRWINVKELSDEELQRMTNECIAEMQYQQELEEERKRQEEAEHRARKRRNRYRPNRAFAGLKAMLEQA